MRRVTLTEFENAGWHRHDATLWLHRDGSELYLDRRYGEWALRQNGAAHLLKTSDFGKAMRIVLEG